MPTWIDRLTSSPTTHAVTLAAQFAERRQALLAENLANVDTPDYQARQLDPQRFQTALADALTDARQSHDRTLKLAGERQVATTATGSLVVRPEVRPAQNVLFHDGTNANVELMMTDVVKNQLYYQAATNLLKKRFDGLLSAIAGQVR